jgi:poly-gamma-glutamate synthesis protein (capsule biosynthesis protein)
MAKELTICAVGDILIDREDPESMFAHVMPVLREADITFGQLEEVITLRDEHVPSTRSPARTHPKTAAALKSVGFDVLSFASNHTLDYGIAGLLDTIEHVKAQEIPLIGVGENLAEARKPAVIESKGTRVAFLSYNTILPKGYEAHSNKPGCVPLRAWTSYQPIEAYQPGTPCRILTFANQEDLEAMKADIQKVRPLADALVVSMHWGLHNIPAELAMYQFEMGHAAIDAGADLILGHHAHILKPIEVYNGKVIFYSLGNFAVERSQKVLAARQDHPEMKATMALYDRKIDPEYPTFPWSAEARKTMIAKCLIADKRIEKVSFLPTMINKQAEPEIVSPEDENFDEIVRYMETIDDSQNLKTRYTVEGGEVRIEGLT